MKVLYGYNMPEYEGPIRKSCHIDFMKTDDNSTHVEAQQIGPINLSSIPFIPNHNPYQTWQGLKKRVIHDQPHLITDDPVFYRRFKNFVDKQVKKLQPLPHMPFSEELLESWLSEYGHGESRKNQIRQAYQDRPGHVLRHRDYRCKLFAKREFYPEKKYIRIINPRSDHFVAQLGPYIHAIDEYIFHQSPLKGYFIKGLKPEEIVNTMNEKFAGQNLFIETDYSSFEGSYSVAYQNIVEWRLLRHMLKHNQHVLDLLRPIYCREINNSVYNPFMSLAFSGSRMSGDLWTSSFNGFSNLMNMLFLCEIHGLTADGFVEGDDGLFHISRPDLTPKDYERLGFSIKLDYQYSIADCAFCQKIYHPDTLHLIAPPRSLSWVGWNHTKRYFNARESIQKELFKAKVRSYYTMYSHSPIVGPVMYALLNSLSDVKDRPDDDWYWNNVVDLTETPDFVPIDPRDRVLYEKRFGIPVEYQIYVEELVASNPTADFDLLFPGTQSNLDCLGEVCAAQ